jgi:DNA polymerase III subunit chi
VRADFYVLAAGDERTAFACRLAEKAFKLGNSVWIRVDEPMLAHMDESLWTFRPESFVPHAIASPQSDLKSLPVWVVSGLPEGHCDLLINLAMQPMDPDTKAARVAELVTQEDAILQLTRKQYALYKGLGWTLNTHKL